jgi:ribosomal protein S18 acetylase RimI-like enzyme
MFSAIKKNLKENTVYKKIVLWGGVQENNQPAVQFYLKNGFQIKGSFRHNNMDNFDMLKEL